MTNTKFLTSAAALLLTFSAGVNADKVIRLHHLNNEGVFDNQTGASAAVFKNLVEAGTNGEITVEAYPNGQLGNDPEAINQIRAGVIQSGIHSVGGFSSVYPMIGVLDMPFAFDNISQTYEVFDGEFGDRLSSDIEEKTGLKVLGFGDIGGFFAITNSEREVRSPEDMRGLRIRTMGLKTHEGVIRSLGGDPVGIAWGEVYTALQTGVADGQMNPLSVISFGRLEEVQDYMTLTNHLYVPYVWSMNQDFWESLSEQEQRVVNSAARSAIVASRGISRIMEASEDGLPRLSEGMEVYSLTPEETEAFRDAAQPAVREVIDKEYGQEGVELLEAYLEAIENTEI